ncbi:MAG: hypothetical protein CTY30_08380 [Methylocystis sp.]|nr:MAG: hypothetical protein CTY30_08380 [Methylocystis sp.]
MRQFLAHGRGAPSKILRRGRRAALCLPAAALTALRLCGLLTPALSDRHRNGPRPNDRREKMSQLNTHIQVGRVGQLKEVGANLVVTVCSNNPYKNGSGEWIDNPEWIEHTIFARQDSRIKWAREKLESGDLVQVTSRPKQTEWKASNGERRFGYTFAVEDIQRLADKPVKKAEAPAAKPQGKKAR